MRRSRNKRKSGAHDNSERWLITYADLITLLMIFFVILYAMSQVDVKKYDTLAQSLQLQFRQADSVIELGTGVNGGIDAAKYRTPSPSAEPTPERAEVKIQAHEQQLQDLLKVIRAYVKDNRLETQVFVADTPKGIAIRLSDRFLFDLGKADLKSDALPVLAKLSSLFGNLRNTISIQGHTDNLPLQDGAVYKDNWGLSAGRALSVLRYFVDVEKLDEGVFEIAGYADTQPIAPNDTEANRQKNRRVEILVLRQPDAS
ncbi:OmpA/MotB family protein [Cohnella nanjingensis]|uniref:Flagellar motor protein MotB n=1 Tax=Cohnella nanjingensis TaxID=1387779 RepID=A0A7X0VEW4_9BACL|nr:flagellar motor protein MotB [Cohnella nanjingensis]MBB6671440.1 flagellar motor protein MotB [Cohnella nanjingensis]